ncbi:MAG: histidine kinase [Saprospiraceae bacterium]
MFTSSETASFQPGIWEQRLTQQKDPLQRLAIIDKLAGHYAYTNVLRAQQLLNEQWDLLKHHEIADFMFHFFLNKMVVENQLYQFEKAASTAQKALDYLEEVGSIHQLTELYIEFAGVCSNIGDIDTADKYLQKAAKTLKSFPDQLLSARLVCRTGYMHLHSGTLALATEHFLQANAIMEEQSKNLSLSDEYILSLTYAGLGQVYEQLGEFEKSVGAYLKVVKLCQKSGFTNRLAWHYLNVGRAYLGVENNEEAQVYLQKVIDTRDDLSLEARASAYANLGFCYFGEGELTKALELLDRAEHLHRELNPEDFHNLAVIASWRGRIQAEQKDYPAAKTSFTAAISLAERQNDPGLLAEAYEHFAALYADMGDYKRAFELQLEHERYWELILEEQDRRQQQELEVKYQAARKEQEAELLELKATQLQLKALRAQMNPHFIYNALNSIQQFITSNDPSTASKYLAKFAKLMRQSLEYSDEESISLEKEIEFLEDYLYINEKLRFEDRLSYRITVDDELEEDILGVPTMIVQPYVENALEHGLRSRKDGLVSVHFYLWDDDTICCIVEDNGIGRQEARSRQMKDASRKNYRSRGTQITEKRLELLRQSKDKEVLVKTTDLFHKKDGSPAGTRVEILIPIVEVQVK